MKRDYETRNKQKKEWESGRVGEWDKLMWRLFFDYLHILRSNLPLSHSPALPLFLLFVSCLVISLHSVRAQQEISYKQVDAIFQEKCIICHSHTLRQSGLNLEGFD